MLHLPIDSSFTWFLCLFDTLIPNGVKSHDSKNMQTHTVTVRSRTSWMAMQSSVICTVPCDTPSLEVEKECMQSHFVRYSYKNNLTVKTLLKGSCNTFPSDPQMTSPTDFTALLIICCYSFPNQLGISRVGESSLQKTSLSECVNPFSSWWMCWKLHRRGWKKGKQLGECTPWPWASSLFLREYSRFRNDNRASRAAMGTWQCRTASPVSISVNKPMVRSSFTSYVVHACLIHGLLKEEQTLFSGILKVKCQFLGLCSAITFGWHDYKSLHDTLAAFYCYIQKELQDTFKGIGLICPKACAHTCAFRNFRAWPLSCGNCANHKIKYQETSVTSTVQLHKSCVSAFATT